MPRTQGIKRRNPSIFRSYIAAVLFDLPQFKGRRWISVPSELGRMLGRSPVQAMSIKSNHEIRPSLAVEIGESVGVDESCVMRLLFDDPEITSIAEYKKKLRRLGRAMHKTRRVENERVRRAGALVPVIRRYGRRCAYSRMLNSAVRSRQMTKAEAEFLLCLLDRSCKRMDGTYRRQHLAEIEKERLYRVSLIDKRLKELKRKVNGLKTQMRYNGYGSRGEWANANDCAYVQYCLAYERVKKARRRQRVHKAGGEDYTTAEWYARMKEYGYKCVYCGAKRDRSLRFGELTLEHVVPMPIGPNELSNIVPACHRCNSSKGDRDLLDWLKGQDVEKVDSRVYEIYRRYKHEKNVVFL